MKLIWLLLYGLASLLAGQLSAQAVTSATPIGAVPAIPPDKGYFVKEIRGGLYWISWARRSWKTPWIRSTRVERQTSSLVSGGSYPS